MKKAAKKATKRGRPAKKLVVIEEPSASINETPENQIEDKFLAIRVCNNPNWIVVRMDGLAVPVKCPPRISNKLVGKLVKVCLVSADPEDYYEYVS